MDPTRNTPAKRRKLNIIGTLATPGDIQGGELVKNKNVKETKPHTAPRVRNYRAYGAPSGSFWGFASYSGSRALYKTLKVLKSSVRQDSAVFLEATLLKVLKASIELRFNSKNSDDMSQIIYNSCETACRLGSFKSLLELIKESYSNITNSLFVAWPSSIRRRTKKPIHFGLYANEFNVDMNSVHLEAQYASSVLQHFLCNWEQYWKVICELSKMFGYLDRVYTIPNSLASSEDVAANLFITVCLSEMGTNEFPAIIQMEFDTPGEYQSCGAAVFDAFSTIINIIRLFPNIYFYQDKRYADLILRFGEMTRILKIVMPLSAISVQRAKDYFHTLSHMAYKDSFYQSVDTYMSHDHESKSKSQRLVDFLYLSYKVEVDLVSQLLGPTICAVVLKVALRTMCVDNLDQILVSFSDILDKKDFKRLSILYFIVSATLDPKVSLEVCKTFGIWVTRQVSKGVEDICKGKRKVATVSKSSLPFCFEIINYLFSFKETIRNLISGPFNNNTEFIDIARSSYSPVMTEFSGAITGSLCLYIDDFMTNNENSNCLTSETAFENIIWLFRMIDGKEHFAENHLQMATRRLLYSTSKMLDAENKLIEELEKECGPDYTAPFKELMDDYEHSKRIESEFQKISGSNFVLQATVCKQAFDKKGAPIGFELDCASSCVEMEAVRELEGINFPSRIKKVLSAYKDFYATKNTRKKMTWCYNISIMEFYMPAWDIDIVVTVEQSLVLLYLETHAKVEFRHLVKKTKAPEKSISAALFELYSGSVPLIEFEGNGPVWCPNDKVYKVEDKGLIVKITEKIPNKIATKKLDFTRLDGPQSAEDEQQLENAMKEAKERADESRIFAVNAAVVRMLKMHKTATKINLAEFMAENLPFIVSDVLLSNSIEALVSKEYIVEKSKDVFQYIP